ncbi:soluble (2Fe-2S) ferredoxin [Prochlorococcus sp. MIT 0601]|nr:soluble (2Fe-2S) ferredoxin [Prochlorococcus sp. MIT 0601]
MEYHKITVHNRQLKKTITLDVPDGEYILRFFESQGENLPFSCRNGCCTTCAVKIISGTLDQSLGIGLSKQMQDYGYALLCIARANGPLEVETQQEDEVYEIQFGKFLENINKEAGNPFDM